MKSFVLLLTCLICSIYLGGSQACYANNTNDKVDQLILSYVEKYKQLAIKEMERSGIPVSIKLAQGLLESRYGTSGLATRANNHFGIKCKVDWKGESVLADDDSPNECFRKYSSVEESYIDHSNFVKNNRLHFYDHLFDIDKRDYRAWSVGLQEAGYATTPGYAKQLVYIIEKFDLFLLDGSSKEWTTPGTTFKWPKEKPGVGPKNKKNQKPKKKELLTESSAKTHTIQDGDTMESIAEKYKIKLELLYELNKMIWGSQPAVGATIFINGRAYKPPPLKVIEYSTKNDPQEEEEEEKKEAPKVPAQPDD